MNEILTVVDAKYVDEYKLMILFNNGERKTFNFSSLLSKGICRKLSDKGYFKNFTIDAFSIDWNNEIGFAPEFLYENGSSC